MREYRLNFTGGELSQQGVVKHHPLGCAEAREVRIGVGTAAAAIHDKKPLGCKAAAPHQLRYALLQGVVFQGLELVEQRCNECGKNHHEQQIETYPHPPGPSPPVGTCLAHQPQNSCGNRQSNGSTQ